MIGKLLCRIGWHAWIIEDEVPGYQAPFTWVFFGCVRDGCDAERTEKAFP